MKYLLIFDPKTWRKSRPKVSEATIPKLFSAIRSDSFCMKWSVRLSSSVTAITAATLVLAAPEAQHRLGGPLVDGSVVRARGCGSRFFIGYRNEFALVEWVGGEMVKELDVLQTNSDQASFEMEGRMTLTNLATGRTIDVIIEKALMNQSDFSRTVREVCR